MTDTGSTVKGESQVAGGLIAGGSAYPPDGDVNGGGVYVADGGTFIMEKGKIIDAGPEIMAAVSMWRTAASLL